MSDVENMALVLSKSRYVTQIYFFSRLQITVVCSCSKTVADLKVRFPNLQDGMKSLLSSEMEKVVREEKYSYRIVHVTWTFNVFFCQVFEGRARETGKCVAAV